METLLNERTPQYYSHRYFNKYCEPNDWSAAREAGSNIKFRQRSKLKRNKKDAYGFRGMSNFSAVEHYQEEPQGSSSAVYPWATVCPLYFEARGFPGGMRWWFSGMFDRLSLATEQSDSILRMRAEANLAQSDINLLQFAAFLPATLKNIYGNLKKMDSLLDILHDVGALKRRFKGEDPRSLYLQWLFVWNQLLRDVNGGVAFLKSKSHPIGSLVTGRAKAESSEKFSDSVSAYSATSVGLATCDSSVSVSQRAVSVARVTCDVSYTYNSLGLDNPVYLLWDLIRWSWVVDQVADVGLFISSITSLHGLDFLGTSVTRRAVNESIVTVDTYRGIRDYVATPSYSPGFSRRKSVVRTVTKNPTRSVSLRNPFQNSVMVTAAVAAAVSLKMSNTKIDTILRIAR